MVDGSLEVGDSRTMYLPADLVAVVVLAIGTTFAILLPVVNESPIRILLGLLFVLFLPGYAFVAALFPAEPDSAALTDETGDETAGGNRRTIDGIERAALSFALSIPVVSLLGLGLSLTPFGVGLASVLPTLITVTLVLTGIAAHRRRLLPEEERFSVPYRSWLEIFRRSLFEPGSRTELVLNVALAGSILIAILAVSVAVAAPGEGEPNTEFYLLTENESGELVADEYPVNLTVDGTEQLVLGIENHEQEPSRYTVVGELQRVDIDGNETTIVESVELDRFNTDLDAGETWREARTIRPTLSGDRLRLVYLLYRGAPPDEPSLDSAYRSVHLWVTVRG